MKPLLTALMLGNAALFMFGALRHAGVAIGALHETVTVSASVVEVLCAFGTELGCRSSLETIAEGVASSVHGKSGCHHWRGDRNGCAGRRSRSADRKQRSLPQNHAGAGDRLARDPPYSARS
jgi:hypothetical protein